MGQAQHIQPLGAGILDNFVRGSRPSLQISPTIITSTHTQIRSTHEHIVTFKYSQELKYLVFKNSFYLYYDISKSEDPLEG